MKRLTVFFLCLTIASFILGSTFSAATQTDIVGLVVDSSGNVGIGTTKPTAGLEINKGNTNEVALKLTSSGLGWGSGVRFVNTTGPGVEYGIFAAPDGTWNFTDEKARLARLVVASSGNVGIGTTTPTAGLEINKGNTNEVALKLTSSGLGWGSGVRFVNTAGVVEYGIFAGSDGTWNFTDEKAKLARLSINTSGDTIVTGNAIVKGGLFIENPPHRDKGNAQWDEDTHQICYDNSSRRDKENIGSLEEDFNKLLDAAPKTYTRHGFPDNWEIGYLAEDFERLGLTRLLYFDKDGRPDAINYTKMGLYLVEIVKNHDKQMKYGEQKIGNLEAEIRQLRAMLERLASRRKRK